MGEIAKGLPRALKYIARDASEHGSFSGATNIYSYNKVQAHLAGKSGLVDHFAGVNALNRSLVRPVKKKPTLAAVHQENAAKYRSARAERELRRMLDNGQ